VRFRGKISTPKNDKTRRIDTSPQLVGALKKHKRGFSLSVVRSTLPQYIFIYREGNLIDKDNWRRRVFTKAVEKAKTPRIRIHDLRHTYATIRIAKGDNIGNVSNQLGHHSVKLTLDIHYHDIPGKKKSEVDALDDPAFKLPNASQVHPTPKKTLKKGLAIIA
jgi:integrase